MVIPADLRDAVGLRSGENLVVWVEADRLVLGSRRAVEEELWLMFKDVTTSMAEELIEERRKESHAELAG